MGNLRSVAKACARAGFPAEPTDRPETVRKAPGVILPGVGAFGAAMENLEQTGLREAVREAAAEAAAGGRPFLGLCLGLQLLFAESEESFGGRNPRGLGVFPGRVVRFRAEDLQTAAGNLKVPQMGWNTVSFRRGHPVLQGVPEGAYFYFVHSYYVEPADHGLTLTTTEYGVTFTSGIARGSAVAFQFHPEKSSTVGLTLLANFGRLVYGWPTGGQRAEPAGEVGR
ncbi:MAG TPA: imidazole glycerol phosphate synthase subunit HisH [Firmicutes bacterium]|nr:imidazole glycerol phosphate synthase subunit HisH [Bacillota bacterium]